LHRTYSYIYEEDSDEVSRYFSAGVHAVCETGLPVPLPSELARIASRN